MSIWYTIAFAFMTLGTFLSHVWSNATNYELMQSQLSVTIGILVIASIAIASLMYFVTYMVAFLFCCEHSLSKKGLKPFIPEKQNTVIKHFSTIHQYEYRIIATKILQFILLWYTMMLAVYAHENELNIYPALTCVLTNGFGLLLFARIGHFFHACRNEGRILYAQ
uniref:Uncharacterized protein n=1 Tax=Panagrolaimus sp. ES5 TaxID=591445 RepID=A0AC34FMK6_9BILA